jgi:hypothetical protein
MGFEKTNNKEVMPSDCVRVLVRRSSKAIDKAAPPLAVLRGRTAPNPGLGMAIELGGSDAGGVGDVVMVSQGLTGKCLAAEDAPPAFNEIEPGGSNRNEGVLDARMSFEPLPDRAAAVAGEIIRDEVEIPLRIGLIERVQQGEIATGIARGCRVGQCLAVAHAQRAIDPDFVGTTLIVQGDFDAVPVHGPAGSGWEIARRHGTEFVNAEDRGLRRRLGVERDDCGPFGAKSGSLLFAHKRVRRQRIPSWRKMRRT